MISISRYGFNNLHGISVFPASHILPTLINISVKNGFECSKFMWIKYQGLSDIYSMEHRGWEWNENTHTFLIIVCVQVTLKNVNVTRDFYFWLKFNWKWNFYEVTCDLSSSASITKNIEYPIIMIHLLNLNQNCISVNLCHQKLWFW